MGQHKRQWVQTGIIGLLLTLAATLPALAQESTATITGTVVDPQNAAVVGATVTAKDTQRGTAWTALTNGSGAFNLPILPVGTYDVTVEIKGFEKAVQKDVVLNLNQTARLNLTLKVGSQTESVEVNAAPPLLGTDRSDTSENLDSHVMDNLPTATTNPNQFTLLAPGAVTPNLFGFQSAQNTFGTGRPYINGAREQENNFILDGMDNNQPDNNDVGFVPAPDAIQEMNMITGNSPADFGNYLGGVVNVTLKSGTNQFHGDVYEYLRNTALNANSWQNNTACNAAGFCGKDANGDEIAPRAGLHWNNFGGTFGGPIFKNKLFFFADYRESLYSQPSATTQLLAIPTAQRGGDFSALCTAGFAGGVCNNTAQQLFDPASNANPTQRTPFLNNQIPVGRFNAAASAIINSPLYPAGAIANNIQRFTTNSYQGDLKIDYQPSEKDHIMGRWSQQYVNAPVTNSIGLLGDAAKTFPLKNAVVDWSHTISSSLINDARVGFSYFPVTEGFSNPTGQNLPTAFGIGGVAVNFLPSLLFSGAGVQPGTIGNNDLVQSFHDTTMQFEDSVTWTHGRHAIHAGFQAYRYIMNDLFPGTAGLAGQFTFNGQFTGNTGTSGGNPTADFLLGLPEDVQQGNGGGGNKYLRNGLFAGFVQDNWRTTDHLTLNAGLRYELTTARLTNNNQDVNFNLITGAPQIGGQAYNTYTGIGNLQPRLGFAWQPAWAKNMVFRGAYGISGFTEANGVNNLPYQNPPFTSIHDSNFSGLALPGSTLSQGFNNFPGAACTPGGLQAFSPACLTAQTLHLTNPNLQPAIDQQWNFSIQRQLGNATTVQVGYVGNKIDHMSDIFIFNQKVLNANGTTSPGPFAQPLLNCCGAGNSPTVRFNDSSGIQRYNALQMSLAQRLAHGLQFQANYTWSKCLSNSLGYFGQFGDEEALAGSVSQTNSSFFFQNNYNARGDYGRCIADVASLFNGYITYDLPVGKGRQFANNVGPVLNGFIGGWSVDPDFTFHTGFAINPSIPDQSGTNSSGATRPNCVGGGVSQYGSGQLTKIGDQIGIQFLNPAAVSAPALGTFGNCAAGSFRGPGLKTVDLNLTKQFPITEKVSFQFRTQFLNLTNTPIFGAPNATAQVAPVPGSNTFGIITSSNPGRQIQFAGKIVF